MNIEFLLLFVDYFKSLKTRNFLLEWAMPLLFSEIVFICNVDNVGMHLLLHSLIDSTLNLLGVLIGFSIAVMTLLVTADNPNFQEIKSRLTKIKIGDKILSLYDVHLINYTYSIIIEIFLVLLIILFKNLYSLDHHTILKYNFINSIIIFLVAHILLLTVRNVTNFYFILFKK